MSAPDAVAVEGLSVHYGGFRALENLTLAIPQGGIGALIGPNGAGKTTCFNAICGFVRPSAGRVLINGVPVALGRPRLVWAHGVARTFQRLELFWTLSVSENLAVAAHRASRLGGRRVRDLDEILRLTDLVGVRDMIVAQLPLGLCRVVELARALATGGDVLLLDESSSGLDRSETQAFEDLVRFVHGRLELSILLVEHDMEFVMSLADRIFVLDFGELIAQGSPAEIRASEIVRRVYLGEGVDVPQLAADGRP